MKTNRILIVSLLLIFLLISGCKQYNSEVKKVIKGDYRNEGIEVSLYTQGITSHTLIYDLESISNTNSMADIFRVFLQMADSLKNEKFDYVYIAFRGKTKFIIKGEYFQQLGQEYSWQNPVYTIRNFPSNVFNIDGSPAYGAWEGGVLGVLQKEMEDFTDFNKKWYLNDLGYQAKE